MDRNDALMLAGVICLAIGLWMIFRPAAFIAVGVALMAVGMMGAWNQARKGSGK